MKLFALILVLAISNSVESAAIGKFLRFSDRQRFFGLFEAIKYDRIIGGPEAKPHSHPYQVGIFLTLPELVTFGSGTLISRNYVLTVPHAVAVGDSVVELFTVVLGAHNIYDEENTLIQSTTAFTHPGWDFPTLQNDIAVIKLPISVELNDKIQLTVLPPFSAVGTTYSGFKALASGWGSESTNTTDISPVMREINVTVVSNAECNTTHGIIQPTMICAIASSIGGTCWGDSGGPVTVMVNEQKIQVGITSFGHPAGCEVPGWPTVYTRVTSYLDWIAAMTDAIILP